MSNKSKYKYPPRKRLTKDAATKELRVKNKLGLSLSPLDLALQRRLIDKDHHRAVKCTPKVGVAVKRHGGIISRRYLACNKNVSKCIKIYQAA